MIKFQKIHNQLHDNLFSQKFLNSYFSSIDHKYDSFSTYSPNDLCQFRMDIYNCAVDFLHNHIVSSSVLGLVVDELIVSKSLFFRNFITFHDSNFYYISHEK